MPGKALKLSAANARVFIMSFANCIQHLGRQNKRAMPFVITIMNSKNEQKGNDRHETRQPNHIGHVPLGS